MKYDAIIVGSGQGGDPLAYRLADLGWNIALIERSNLGGTCINTGCTPTKTMIHRAQVAHYGREASRWGVRTGKVSVDLAKIVAQKKQTVEYFRAGLQQKVNERPNLHLYSRHARFENPRQIKAGEQILEGDRFFIDTGSRPHIPDIPGLDKVAYLTNATLMELTELPNHLVILGGGYVGLEFGQMFRRFGSRVTVIHDGDQILTREDREIAAELQKALEAEGVEFLLNAHPIGLDRKGRSVVVALEGHQGPKAVTGSHLLVATGRRPNSDDMGIEKAGVEVDKNGFIKVNPKLETNVPGIWALGDVTGGPAFTHISYNDFQIIYGNLVEGKDLSTDQRIVPYCVFTDPQLGRIGMTEKEARAKGYKLKVGKIPMNWVARAVERDETAGSMKIVVDAATDCILGASILCSEGGELVQILGAVILAGHPYTLLKGAVYIHPTLAEGFFSLMEEVKPVN